VREGSLFSTAIRVCWQHSIASDEMSEPGIAQHKAVSVEAQGADKPAVSSFVPNPPDSQMLVDLMRCADFKVGHGHPCHHEFFAARVLMHPVTENRHHVGHW
jgi:hypothetical protein